MLTIILECIFFNKLKILSHKLPASHGRNAGHPAPPAPPLPCGFPASGSPVERFSARIFTVIVVSQRRHRDFAEEESVVVEQDKTVP